MKVCIVWKQYSQNKKKNLKLLIPHHTSGNLLSNQSLKETSITK